MVQPLQAESELHAIDRQTCAKRSSPTRQDWPLRRRPAARTAGSPAASDDAGATDHRGGEALTRTPPRAQGPGGPTLPALLGAGGHRSIPMQPAEKDSVGQMLMLWAGRATDSPSPFRQVRGQGGAAQEDVESGREHLRVDNPQAGSLSWLIRLLSSPRLDSPVAVCMCV